MIIWKEIPGYEGLYEVSNVGTVKRLSRRRDKDGEESFLSEKLLKTAFDKDGYVKVTLNKNSKLRCVGVHRLVLLAFVGIPDKENNIGMHINDVPSDNNLSNLKWGSHSLNSLDAYNKGRRISPFATKEHSRSRPVIRMDRNGNELQKYGSIRLALKELTVGDKVSTIWEACAGRSKTAFGYRWKFAS